MPRKAPSDVVEHRITFGNAERDLLNKVAGAYDRDKWLENIPYVLQGTGVVLVGAGVTWGAYGLWTWLTGEKVLHKFFKTTNKALDSVVGTTLEAVVGYDPIEHIRQRQALDDEFEEIASRIDLYCSTGSREYDTGKCTLAYADRDEWEARRDALKEQQAAEVEAKAEQKAIGVMVDATKDQLGSWEGFKKGIRESLLNPATWFD